MLTFASKYYDNIYSQFGEDGIINECLRRINPSLKVAVEFGGHNGTFCSNTAALRDQGWTTYMYDLEAHPPHVERRMITPENVNQLPECSVLSIDIDGNDHDVWSAYESKPDIVIIEINSSISPTSDVPVSDMQDGTAYRPMVQLGIFKGYFLLCHTGNCIFIRNDHFALFPEVEGDGILNHQLYFNTSHL